MTDYKTSVKNAMDSIRDHVDDMAGIIVAEFSKEAAIEIGEMWAWKVVELLIDNRKYTLSDLTIKNRRVRGISIMGDDVYLIETGQLLESIEVVYKHVAGKGADVLELGITSSDTHATHGAANPISMQTLMNLNEYGFTAKGVSIPARPVLKQAALEIGYEKDRIISNEFNRFIRGRTVQKFINIDTIVGAATVRGIKSPYKSDVGFTAVGKIKRSGSEFYFEWDANGQEYQKE